MTVRSAVRMLMDAAVLAGLAVAGAAIGGVVGSLGLVTANEGPVSVCERDRCVQRSGGCEDAGQEDTSCNLHDFGCGTIPCGLSMDELARFDREDAADLWIALGPRVIPRLARMASGDDERLPRGARTGAPATLARMAGEWDVEALSAESQGAMSRLAVAYTRHPFASVAMPDRVESLMHGIALAAALGRDLDHPYHRESVRLLEDPDTVRARLADGGALPDAAVEEIANYARRSR